MTISNPQSDHREWQRLYSATASYREDLKKCSQFIIPVTGLILCAILYTIFGYADLYVESWAPQNISQLSLSLYSLRILAVVCAPLIAMSLGLSFIFKRAETFIRTMYQPEKHEKLSRLIQRRLLMSPSRQFVVILVPSLNENHWSRWLGGPATLLIYDGVAVYLENRNHVTRVVGPGISFLEEYERIKEVVDLRPQTKTGTVMPWTKDGIKIRLTIRAECQIDACSEALAQSSNFRFPFDPLAVKTAVERMTVKAGRDGELFESSWLEDAWGAITGLINAYVARYSLDELFLAPQARESAAIGALEKDPSKEIEKILSNTIREELDKAKKNLALNGVKVLAIQITNVEVPQEVVILRAKYWETAQERIAVLRNSRAEADNIRLLERTRADAQHKMLSAITQKLADLDPNNLTETLILSVSGIMDQGLEDPIVRPLLTKESFAVLDTIRQWLKDGF